MFRYYFPSICICLLTECLIKSVCPSAICSHEIITEKLSEVILELIWRGRVISQGQVSRFSQQRTSVDPRPVNVKLLVEGEALGELFI